MDNIARLVFEGIPSGKIDRELGVEILKLLKQQEGMQKKQDIAIIGIAFRLPSANDPAAFWENLKSGRDCIADFPQSRQADADNLIQYTYVKDRKAIQYCRGGYLEDIDRFDYRFFGLSPKEASLMDPNQRLFLETAVKAVEDAGYGGDKLGRSSTGLYVGYSGWPMYGQFISHAEPDAMSLSVLGNISAIIAARLSNHLNIKGPSMLVDTACSSSLTALHLALRGIADGDCTQAIVGGIRTLLLPVDETIKYGIESRDFKARPFDDNADGTPLSEGIAAILIKPLGKAVQDGDNIYGVIKGSAVNQDGFTQGFVTPNAAAQTEVLQKAWSDAGIDPETISYIEAHGIGTRIGDSLEIEGISKAFKKYTDKKHFCAIGALKANIGHTDSCAGLAAVIKAVLALRNRQLPPVANFITPNSNINFSQSPVYINEELTDWEWTGSPRRCGVSCFGFGGSNCHVVLEEYTAQDDKTSHPEKDKKADPVRDNDPNIFTLSAYTTEALSRSIRTYQAFIRTGGFKPLKLEDICYTANTGRGSYNVRLALLVKDKAELEDKLLGLDADNLHSSLDQGLFYKNHKRLDNVGVDGLGRDAVLKIQELLRGKVQNSQLCEELCLLYAEGAKINWEDLYSGGKRSRVSLPAYEFDRHRCWIKVPGQGSQLEAGSGELLDNILNEDISFNL